MAIHLINSPSRYIPFRIIMEALDLIIVTIEYASTYYPDFSITSRLCHLSSCLSQKHILARHSYQYANSNSGAATASLPPVAIVAAIIKGSVLEL
jgi:hypothetical protein